MFLKKSLPVLLLILSSSLIAQDSSIKLKVYGFVRNDFYYNSRKNEESTDGVFNFFPKPVDLSEGIDKNAVAQAELLSINSRIGLDISGSDIFGAKSSAKIESDFAGTGATFFLLRIRQAYMKLNWKKSELLIGQAWHPMFGNVYPTVMSLNVGAPFQPFNRSPQLRFSCNANNSLSITGAALYEMQFMSQGPNGASSSYMKNAMIPDLFLGAEYKTSHWISGIGLDAKTLKPDANQLTSVSSVVYSQYTEKKLQLKAKATYGQNLTDMGMIGGYAVSKFSTDSITALSYSNLNTLSSWFNAVYGDKIQVGIFVGYSKNLGSESTLAYRKGGKISAYGCGFYDSNQQQIDQLIRISPQISYNLPNLKFGLELDYTMATYGTIQNSGKIISPYNVDNKRVVATMSYIF